MSEVKGMLMDDFAWGLINYKTDHHVNEAFAGNIHFSMVPFSSSADPESRILCLMARNEGFEKGRIWHIAEDQSLVTCQDCIEYIHS